MRNPNFKISMLVGNSLNVHQAHFLEHIYSSHFPPLFFFLNSLYFVILAVQICLDNTYGILKASFQENSNSNIVRENLGLKMYVGFEISLTLTTITILSEMQFILWMHVPNRTYLQYYTMWQNENFLKMLYITRYLNYMVF